MSLYMWYCGTCRCCRVPLLLVVLKDWIQSRAVCVDVYLQMQQKQSKFCKRHQRGLTQGREQQSAFYTVDLKEGFVNPCNYVSYSQGKLILFLSPIMVGCIILLVYFFPSSPKDQVPLKVEGYQNASDINRSCLLRIQSIC